MPFARRFPLPRLRVADRGLREGMLVEMMREDGAHPRVKPIGAFDARNVLSRDIEPGLFRRQAMTDMAKDTTGRLRVTVKTGGKRKLSSKRWLERQLNDPYVAGAGREGYRSRAAYKLIEIDDKYHNLRPAWARGRSGRRPRRLEPGGGGTRR